MTRLNIKIAAAGLLLVCSAAAEARTNYSWWVTTEGAGMMVSGGDGPVCPVPAYYDYGPDYYRYRHARKKYKKARKKYRKEMKKWRKEQEKYYRRHHGHHKHHHHHHDHDDD